MARFVAAPGIARAVARSPATRAMLTRKGRKVLDAAKSSGSRIRRSGDYASAFELRVDLGPKGWRARVVNTDFKAGFIEFGTTTIAKHRVLGRALDAAR